MGGYLLLLVLHVVLVLLVYIIIIRLYSTERNREDNLTEVK